MDEREQDSDFDAELREKIMDGLNTPIEDCIPEEDIVW